MRRGALITVVLVVLLLVGGAPQAIAAHIHQSRWGASAYYPGDQATFYMTLFNDYPGTIVVKEILMQFDWQSAGDYYTVPGGQTLIPIQTADYLINFTIPLNASLGQHVWTVYYIDANDKQNFVGQGPLRIHDPNERAYLNLQTVVEANLTRLSGAAFENPNATALLSSAISAFNNATSSADSGDFVGAQALLRNASSLIAQAVTAEADYQTLKKAYLSDLSSTATALDKAKSFNYQSQNATQYLNQATVAYGQATFLASARNYERADALIRTAASLIDRANAAEHAYLGQGSTTSATSYATSTNSQQTSTTTTPPIVSSTSTTVGSSSQSTAAPPAFPMTLALGGLAGIVLVGSLLVVLKRQKR